MEKYIQNKLSEIEKEENIRILFAVESGSRAWGAISPDSDYDVRFIYSRPKEYYLRLDQTKDTLIFPINDNLDINGWDLDKALKLLYKSNPTLFEWFSSPIIYRKTDISDRFAPLLDYYFSAQTCMHHYLGIAETKFKHDVLSRTETTPKKYLYILRPILACKWIIDKNSPAPILLSALKSTYLDEAYESVVERLLQLKTEKPEVHYIPKVECIDNYIKNSLIEIRESLNALPKTLEKSWNMINSFFVDSI